MPIPAAFPRAGATQLHLLATPGRGWLGLHCCQLQQVPISVWLFLILDHTFANKCLYLIGEGNGTPLQYSCLENPMDGGDW